jgi:CBS-domain-containing membrane protein
MLVQDVMSSPAVTVRADESVIGALRLMDEHHVTSLPVVGRHGQIVGIVGEADVLRHRVLHDPRAHMLPHRDLTAPAARVAQVMGRALTVDPRMDLNEVVELMATTEVKSLPVVEEGMVVGVVSRSDVVHLLARQDGQIRNEVMCLLTEADLHCDVEVRDGIVSLLALDNPLAAPAAKALSAAVAGVAAVQVFT